MILFTQSTAVLHKHLNDELKILCLLQFFQGCTEFPEFSMFREIPEYSRFVATVYTISYGRTKRYPQNEETVPFPKKATLFVIIGGA